MIFQPYIMIPTAAVLAASALGLFLALRGRRRGSERLCRRCGYELTGLTSGRCPECGADVSAARAVVIGRRVRRWRLAAVSTVVLIISSTVSVAVLSGWASQVNWRHYAPYAWLRWRALAGHLPDLAEIERRFAKCELSAADRADLIESLLAAYHAAEPKAACGEFAAALRTFDSTNGLTGEQRDRFYADMMQVRVVARSPIREGDPLPVALSLVRPTNSNPGRKPAIMSWVINRSRINRGDWNDVGKRLIGILYGTNVVATNCLSEAVAIERPSVRVGDNEVELEVIASLALNGGQSDAATSWWSKKSSGAVRFQVLPAESPDPVKLIQAPAMRAPIRRALKHAVVKLLRSESSFPFVGPLQFVLHEQLPCNIAFDVVVCSDRAQHVIGPFVSDRARPFARLEDLAQLGATVDWNLLARKRHERAIISAVESSGGRAILRANPDLARRTVDIFEIWDGEIDLGPINVLDNAKQSSP